MPAPLVTSASYLMPCCTVQESSHDAVRHVHERAAHPTPRFRAFQMILRVKVGSDRDARRLDACKKRESLYSFPPVVSMRVHIVLALELYPLSTLCAAVHAPPNRVLVESNPIGCPWRAIWTRMRKRGLPVEAVAIRSCAGVCRGCRCRSR